MASITPKKPRKQQIKTPKRQEIIDRHQLLYQKPSQIKKVTNISTPTVRRVIKSDEPRINSKSHIDRSLKLSSRDIRRLIRVVTSSQDKRRASYIQLTKELKLKINKQTIRRALRKAGFKRYIAYLKPLIL